ncbi:MAG: cytochrome P460 family protein [Bauldia sp.]|nr:cytochrome P460 family protein [Bauldia sp.]
MTGKRRLMIMAAGATAAIGVATLVAAQVPDERIPFPADYATEFTMYLEIDRIQNPGQVMRIYANDAALLGPGPDGRLADGAILVGEIYGAKTDAAGNVIISELGRRIRGDIAAIAVMEKEDGWGDLFPADLRNGDWDFAMFSPAGERLDRDLNACRACHAPLQETDHVFSIQHLPTP